VVCDGNGGCDTSVVIITVTPVNDPPVNVLDTILDTTPEDTPILICVASTDVDGDTLDVTSAFGGPTSGTLSGIGDGDTCFTYTPDPNFNGNDTVSVIVCDGNGGCDTTLVVITVTPVNDPPVNDLDTILDITPEDTPIQICITSTDVEGDPLDATSAVNGPSNGSVSSLSTGDTCFTYTPDPDFNGNDTLEIVVCDVNGGCDTSVVIITVTPVNDPPVIISGNTIPEVNDSITSFTTPEDTALQICFMFTDPDGDDVDASAITFAPTNGSISGIADDDSCIAYIPDPNFYGSDTIVIVACDNGTPSLCDTVTLVITVTPINDPPIANDDYATVDPFDSITVPVEINDSDLEGPTTVTILSGPSNGVASVVGDSIFYNPDNSFLNGFDTIIYVLCDTGMPVLCDTAMLIIEVPENDLAPYATDDVATTDEDVPVTIDVQSNDFDPNLDSMITTISSGPSNGAITILGGDSILYTPDPDFNGVDTFYYSVCDTTLPVPMCDTAMVVVTVNPVQDPPIITDGTNPVDTIYETTPEDTPINIVIIATDADGDNLDVVNAINGPSNGSISGINDNDTAFTYTPDPGFVGNDTVSIVVCDNGAPTMCDTVVVIITVTPVNDMPVISADTIYETTPEDIPITICISVSDADGDTLDITSSFNGPTNGTVSGIGNGDTCFTYTPDPNYNGQDTVSVVVCDPYGGCDTVIVIITVTPVNDPPTLDPDTINVTTPQDTSIIICVSGTDIENDTLDVTGVSTGPSNGSISGLGDGDTCFTYTPDSGFVGVDTVEIIVCDGNGGCDTAVVIITVTPIPSNTPPDITSGNGTTLNGDTLLDTTNYVTSLVLCFDGVDAEGDSLSVSNTLLSPGNGTLSGIGTSDTCFTYTPDSLFVGSDTMTIVICDNGSPSLCDTIVVIMEILPAPPIAVDDSVPSISGPTQVDVLVNDIDPNGGSLNVTILDSPSNGTASTDATSITYVPLFGYCGPDSLSYVACNSYGLCDTAWVYFNVLPADTDGDGIPDYIETLTADTDGDGTLNYLSLDSDGDGIPDSYEALGDLSDICNVLLADTDGDGIPDYLDLDADGDGIPDEDEWNGGIDNDCDGDGIPDFRDPEPCLNFRIPQGFSPNGDGVNDYFVIIGLEDFPENTLIIFNRWGNKIFEATPYNNDWDGTNKFGVTFGDQLPEGTYFYLLTLTPDEEPINDYIYLTR